MMNRPRVSVRRRKHNVITFDPGSGAVTIDPLKDQNGNVLVGFQALLLQAAIDRAAKNTIRVELLQTQLQAQNDQIHFANDLMARLLNSTPTDPAKNQGATIAISPPLSAKDKEIIRATAVKPPENTLDKYFKSLDANPLELVNGKSFNDVTTAMKNEVNRLTNQNQQEMINYQSMINQRNQMLEWVASLITMMATQTSSTIANLR